MKKSDHNLMLEKDMNKLLKRIEKLHTNLDNRCAKTGFVRIAPKVDGRLKCLGDPIEHAD